MYKFVDYMLSLERLNRCEEWVENEIALFLAPSQHRYSHIFTYTHTRTRTLECMCIRMMLDIAELRAETVEPRNNGRAFRDA